MKPTTQKYNDGLLTISKVSNTADAGELPVDGLTPKHTEISYDNRTVGMSRFWQGKQVDVRIDRLIRCPTLPDVHPLDVVTTEDGQTYQIEQIQYPKDVEPPSMDLSLSVIKVDEELQPVPDEEEGVGEDP
jgi:hypothetical protein